jgi:hypothetical protein
LSIALLVESTKILCEPIKEVALDKEWSYGKVYYKQMTVKELIEELKRFPDDLAVMTYTGWSGADPIKEVSLDKEWSPTGADVVFIEGGI